jgi:hypothetical protein
MVTVVVAACAWLTACGDDDTVADPPPDPSPTTASTTTSGSSTGGSGAGGSGSGAEALVELATSGGDDGQGIGDLVVSPDGEAQLHDPQGGVTTATLSPDELDALVAALDDADFAGAPTAPDIDDVCPDALAYTVVYQEWQVTADTCTIPDEVAPVVDELQAILYRLG